MQRWLCTLWALTAAAMARACSWWEQGSAAAPATLVVMMMMIVVGAASGYLEYPCGSGFEGLGFCDVTKPIPARVAELVGSLTLQEKALQLVNGASGVPRLGIPPYEWWSEGLHGVSNVGPGVVFGGSIPAATSFPEVILSAASFNADLWYSIGQVVSTEARAMYNVGQSGLTFWSPNINILRDPRWGRAQETPGEDPLLTSIYATKFVQGMQSIDYSDPSKPLKVAACCKHYTAYDLDQWEGVDRFHFDAQVSAQDLGDTYNPPFQACVQEGDVASVMCSYNRINGVPSCADKTLLSDVVRDQWNLDGYIVSDCDSVEVMYDDIHYTASPEESVADTMRAGLNLNCGVFFANYTANAVEKGLLEESDVDKSLTYAYTTLMRLGYFDGNPRKQRWGELGPDQVCSDEHQQLAVYAAKQGIVLLKNSNQRLPLSKDLGRVAVIGPNANATEVLRANYAGLPCRNTTALNGIQHYVNATYVDGCGGTVACSVTSFDSSLEKQEATSAAQEADAVVLVMGLDQTEEREGFDRTSLLLPGQQQALIESVALAAHGPVILVIMSGGPVDVSFAQSNPTIHSIIWVGYPGEAGGDALASVLFGDHNPSGRLPNTWYTEDYTSLPMTNMRIRTDPSTGYPGRTYRFYNSSSIVLYDFGYGLSYTNFAISMTSSDAASTAINVTTTSRNASSCVTFNSQAICDVLNVDDIKECPVMDVKIDISNVGHTDGTRPILLMWHPPAFLMGTLGAPSRQLISFQAVHVPAYTTRGISFSINACKQLSLLAPDGVTKVLPLASQSLSVAGDGNSNSPSISLLFETA